RPRAVSGLAEDRGHHRLRQAGLLVAVDVGSRFRRDARTLRDVRDARARAHLLDEIVRLASERLVDLLGPLLFLDLGLRLLECEVVRRVDLGDHEPDEAAVLGVERRFVDSDVGCKRRAQQLRLIRQVDGRAFGIVAAGVDRGDGLRGQPDRVGGLDERFAGNALVLDLVVQRLDLVAGARSGDLPFDLVLDLRQRLDRRWRYALHANDDRTELALEHATDASLRQRED